MVGLFNAGKKVPSPTPWAMLILLPRKFTETRSSLPSLFISARATILGPSPSFTVVGAENLPSPLPNKMLAESLW